MEHPKGARWKWSVCALLLLATTINYMDRQTLALLAGEISKIFQLSKEQYGNLEMVFGLAFAAGGIISGLAADRFSVRWMYPMVLVGWSLAGLATAYAEPIGQAVLTFCHDWLGSDLAWLDSKKAVEPGYLGLLICRGVLGFFEAGQWPCALVASQRILSRADRTLGNSMLQSGAALGAILTPPVVQLLVTYDGGDSWRLPFLVIGAFGLLWVVPWWRLVGPHDLDLRPEAVATGPEATPAPSAAESNANRLRNARRLLVLAVLVVTINLTWHFFRAWMPLFLGGFHHYDTTSVNYFTPVYFAVADVGCISTGLIVHRLIAGGMRIHSARLLMFWVCSFLAALSTIAASLPRGPLLLGILLVVGFGTLGLFPIYYSFSQEISARHQGKISGALGATTWTVTALMHKFVGRSIDETGSYALGLFVVGLAPLVGAICVTLFWGKSSDSAKL